MKEINVSKQLGETAYRTRPGRGLQRHLRAFYNDESGVIVAFSVWFMLMILFVGALGVDVMRFETHRTRLQSALDQAVLAAADLDQTLPPTQVVASYLDKFDIDADLTSTVVDEGLTHRKVTAIAKQDVPTQLVHMLGVDKFVAPALSAAEERVDNVEISLVLDVSGSMSGNKLSRLKVAAKEFVTSILPLNQANDITISIIPYATQVAAGEHLLDELRVSEGHDYSSCVNINTNDFNDNSFDLKGSSSREYEQTQHFDVFSYSEGELDMPICPSDPAMAITPLSNDPVALHAAIDALTAGGNTSIDLGIKWGAAMLDPNMRPAIQGIIEDGVVDARFSNRPLAYSGSDVIKVMVVMTDGQNTTQYRLADHLRTGMSNAWYNPTNGRYGAYSPSNDRYYVQDASGNSRVKTTNSFTSPPTDYVRLSYQDLYAQASAAWIAYYIFGPIDSNAWEKYYTNASDVVHPGSSKDGHTQTMCNSVKQSNVVVYTIGFEAPKHSQNLLESCASTRSHFFDVEGVEIEDAFSAIAQSISQLKLIQ